MSKKKTLLPITSAGDLVALVNNNTDIFDHSIRKLSRRTRKLGIITIGVAGLAWVAYRKNKELEEEVYQLSIKVKKLENSEGE